mgnify:CR=1 FL=1
MFKTDITYISDNSNMRSYSVKRNRGEIKVSKPSRFKQQPKILEIKCKKHYPSESSKFVLIKMEESVAEKLIEVLKPMLEDDSTQEMEKKLNLEWNGKNTDVEIK